MSQPRRSNPLIVLCAALGRGHLTPMMGLARSLASTRQVSVTLIFQTQGAFSSVDRALFSSLDIEFVVLCEQDLNEDPPWMSRRALRLREVLLSSPDPLPVADLSVEEAALEGALRDLLQSSSPPVCFISDFSQPWAAAPARKLGIPSYVLYTDSASFMAVAYEAENLVQSGALPAKCATDKIFVPGVPPLVSSDITNFVWDSSHVYFPMQKLWHDKTLESDGILLNTFYELESPAIDALRSTILAGKGVKMFEVGPLISASSTGGSSFGFESSAWKQCADWLDSKPEASVLYISFGSWEFLPDLQVMELARGLESSGCHFLWMLNLPPGYAESSLEYSMLPQGFRKRMMDAGRGLIVTSWLPQRAVLKHSSIGGFLSHCGWNSVLECVSLAGVPMICWPFLADQPINSRFLVSGLEIGVEVHGNDSGFVDSVDVEKSVREVFNGDRTRAVRAQRLKHVAAQVLASGNTLKPFLENLNLHKCDLYR